MHKVRKEGLENEYQNVPWIPNTKETVTTILWTSLRVLLKSRMKRI
jgi:hypothetical protein